MKVLQIIDSLDTGGAERVFVDLVNLLFESNKVEVSVLTFNADGNLYSLINKKIVKVSFQRDNKFNIQTAYKLSKILKDYDLIHIHMRQVYRYVKVVSLIFGIKTKLILHDHYGSISEDKTVPKFFNTILKPKYYIGVSEELIQWAREKVKIKNVYKLSNIIIKENDLPISGKKEGIVIVGNIKPIKNQLFAIQFAALLKKKLTIIGEIHDLLYFDILMKEIRTLNYESKVHFLNGVHHIQRLLPNFEFGLMTSKSESGPLVLIEYLAQDLPFLAYETGDVSQSLKEILPNFFVNNFDIKEWEHRIIDHQIENRNLVEVYLDNYSPNKYINECIKIYQNIVNY